MLPITLDAPLDVLNAIGAKLHTLPMGYYVALPSDDPHIGTCALYEADANFDVKCPSPILAKVQLGGVNGELIITA